MKKAFFISLFCVLVGLAPHAFADGFTALAPIPGLTDANTANSASGIDANTLANFFNNLYKYLVGLAATIAVIEIIWGGLEISTPDSVVKEKLGKERIYNAIFGLVLVLSPVIVFSIINPSILNLSLNLPALNATPTTTGTTTAALPPCVAGNTAGAGTTCTLVPLLRTGGENTLPTCGPGVVGSCVNTPPACTPGQYCYLTTNTSNIAGVVCSAVESECNYLFTQQNNGNNTGVTATRSCQLCPK